MLRNVPETFLRDDLTRLLVKQGFEFVHDFVYMPMNFRSKASFGYAFVNLTTPAIAQQCHERFQGFTDWGVPSDKVCEVSWSNMHQGLESHIERYRNSPVMHESIQDAYKPAMYKDGIRIQFPGPTKKICQPRIRKMVDENKNLEWMPVNPEDLDAVEQQAHSELEFTTIC